ncbi:serine/threonine-protein kinase [Urbifossiella limnaea]|uniref:Serine/threonine-protein kinase PknB n=1 Tax=Urbifossiella limnaea TaxID=2528023 RepID=A0A517XWC9_9BACT|nr:serine/threonine-protein kinase [Urbifossiella limnaea]QDU21819.1 Serine/threonine-protein kinase PknB [Urbifossiella limnaea]
MDDDPLLDRLSAWQAAFDRGAEVSPAELCRGRPDLLPELERRVADLRRVAQLAATPPPADPDTTRPSAGGGPTPAGPPADTASFDPGPGGYEIGERVGGGGMGDVYRAHDPQLGRDVAVKAMKPALAADPAARARFLREARAAAAVRHDHLCPIYHVGETTAGPFLVMPLLAGETLAARLARGPLPPAEVARVGREAALGLAAAHAAGLIHRDIKPANLWLEAPTGRVVVLDFGLARVADADDGLSQPGRVAGTPSYMSPEQVDGRPLDPRTDLFSLGAVLYEAATGVRAFAGPSLTAVLKAVADASPPPPDAVNPAVPPALSAAVIRLLAKRPADRPPSASSVADALARVVGPAGDTDTVAPAPAVAAPPPPRPAARWPVRVAALVLLMTGAAAGWYAIRPPAPAPSPEPPAAAAAVEPLRVVSFEVRPWRPVAAGGTDVRPLPVLGREDSFSATVADFIDVKVTLSRPAYAYLILFRGDGADTVLYPQDDADEPEKSAAPHYPSKRREALYGLDDGPGLWAVGLVTSEDRLPPYREWRGSHPGGPWGRHPAPTDTVLFDDGAGLDVLVPGRPATRGSRGEKTDINRRPVVALVDWLKGQAGGPVAAVAFPVTAVK